MSCHVMSHLPINTANLFKDHSSTIVVITITIVIIITIIIISPIPSICH